MDTGRAVEEEEVNYDVLLEAQSGGEFISSVTFLEDGFEFGLIDQSKQSEKFATMETVMVRADSERQQLVYAQMQEMARDVINEAYIQHREG